MRVVSFFDGLSGAQIALKKLSVVCDYYAVEIDKYAISITQKNFPNTHQLGDILQFFEKHKTVEDINNSKLINLDRLPKEIDLLIGGSPCTDLSSAKNNGKGLEGEQSRLFWAYLRILNYYYKTQTKPFYFVLENVESMKTKDFVIMTNQMGVEPIMLDAALVSAQRRKRYFWTNIPNVKNPIDRGLVIADILDPDAIRETVSIKCADPKCECQQTALCKNRIIKTSNGIRWNGHQKTQKHGLQGCQAVTLDQKSLALDTSTGKRPTRIVSGTQSQKAVDINNKGFVIDAGLGRKYPYRIVRNQPQGMSAQNHSEKSFSLCATNLKNKTLIVKDHNSQQNRAFADSTKHGTLAASRVTSKTNIVFDDLRIEKLTWNEIERLAGLPVGYTDLGEGNNKNDHRGRAIGNGFQIDIIVHLLSFLLKFETPLNRSQEILKGEQQDLFLSDE